MFSMLDNPRQDFRIVTRDLEHVVGCFGPGLDECDHLSLLTRDSFQCQFAENLLPPPDKSYARVGMGALLDRQCAAMKR